MLNLDGIVPGRSQKVNLPQPGEADPSQPRASLSLENARDLLRSSGVVLDVCAAAAAQNAVASGWEELWQQGHEAHAALTAIQNGCGRFY